MFPPTDKLDAAKSLVPVEPTKRLPPPKLKLAPTKLKMTVAEPEVVPKSPNWVSESMILGNGTLVPPIHDCREEGTIVTCATEIIPKEKHIPRIRNIFL